MVRKLLIKLVKLYQVTPISTHGNCRYNPTCSEYMIQSLEKYGAFKGLFKGIYRILRCNPFSKGGYDPVCKEGDIVDKKKEKKNPKKIK